MYDIVREEYLSHLQFPLLLHPQSARANRVKYREDRRPEELSMYGHRPPIKQYYLVFLSHHKFIYLFNVFRIESLITSDVTLALNLLVFIQILTTMTIPSTHFFLFFPHLGNTVIDGILMEDGDCQWMTSLHWNGGDYSTLSLLNEDEESVFSFLTRSHRSQKLRDRRRNQEKYFSSDNFQHTISPPSPSNPLYSNLPSQVQ